LSKLGTTSRFGACTSIALKDIVESPYQVRVDYGDIEGLAKDIKQKGLLQPILVRPVDGGKLEVVHGHRRRKAVEILGWQYIDAFSKKLTDSEAITIQGSENIWRKSYTPIEEARLYSNYKKFLEEEKKHSVSIKEVAEAFKVPNSDVENKINLLSLPEEIQDKLQQDELPFSKVRQLTILTREKPSADRRKPQYAPRTDRYYSEIKRLADEIQKGPLGGLRTEKGVAQAAKNIRGGVAYEDAVKQAKIDEAIALAHKQVKNGESPEKILKSIMENQEDPSKVLEATIEANIGLLKKLLKQKLILCPYCGKPDLTWGCCGKRVVEEDEERN